MQPPPGFHQGFSAHAEVYLTPSPIEQTGPGIVRAVGSMFTAAMSCASCIVFPSARRGAPPVKIYPGDGCQLPPCKQGCPHVG